MARCFHPSLIGPEAWEGYVFSDMEIRIKESTDLYGAVLWPSVRPPTYASKQTISCWAPPPANRKPVFPQQAMVLCHFLETNRDQHNLTDKNVIELGAGTGLVSIVSSLLGTETKHIWGSAVTAVPVCSSGFVPLSGAVCSSLPITPPPLLCLCPGAKVTSTDLPDLLGNLQYNVTRNTKGRCKYIPLVSSFALVIRSGRSYIRPARFVALCSTFSSVPRSRS